MTDRFGETNSPELGDSESVLSESNVEPRIHEDTDINFETAVFTSPERCLDDLPDPSRHGNDLSERTGVFQECRQPIPKKTRGAKNSRPVAGPFAIETTVPARTVGVDGDLESPIQWHRTWRVMPGWLTSLIFHLSVIMILALVSFSDGGRNVIALLASANESVQLEPITAFELISDPPAMETLAEEIELPASQLIESTDLAPVLDEALLSASLAKESVNSMFESISTEGISESDLPRRIDEVGTRFFGVEGKGSNFVFIIDCSGSMADYGRWQQAVRELKKSVAGLKKEQKFLILLYNDGFIAMNDEAKMVASTQREQKKAFHWLSRNTPDSWTFCAAALGKALSLQPDAVFLLSDGEFNDRQDVFMVLESMNSSERFGRYKQRQIPVHTIALGSHQGSWTMKRIAEENSGNFQLIE